MLQLFHEISDFQESCNLISQEGGSLKTKETLDNWIGRSSTTMQGFPNITKVGGGGSNYTTRSGAAKTKLVTCRHFSLLGFVHSVVMSK